VPPFNLLAWASQISKGYKDRLFFYTFENAKCIKEEKNE
jgi:hypothetical protein